MVALLANLLWNDRIYSVSANTNDGVGITIYRRQFGPSFVLKDQLDKFFADIVPEPFKR
jgi:hypothetical protein